MTLVRIETIASRIVSLDIEGDGGRPPSPIEIGVVEIHPEQGAAWSTLVSPPGPIGRFASRVHGLHDSDMVDAPYPVEVHKDLLRVLDGAMIVGHSIRDDLKVLQRAFPILPGYRAIDTLPMSRQLFPGLPSYSLQAVAAAMGIEARHQGRGPHSALYDASLDAELFMRLCAQPGADLYLRGAGLKVPRGDVDERMTARAR